MFRKYYNWETYTINQYDYELDDKIKLWSTLDNTRYYYNQKNPKSHSSCCTLYSHIAMVSDLYNHKFSDGEIEEIVQYAETRWYVRKKGWDTYKACDTVRKRWNNKYPNDQIISFRAWLGEKPILEALDKGYSIVVSLKGNKYWSRDRERDGFIDNQVRANDSTRWHAIRVYKSKWDIVFGDSYAWYRKDTNIYFTKHSLLDLVVGKWLYPTCYIYLKANEIEYTKAELMMLKCNSLLWKIAENETIKDMYHKISEKIRLK